MPGRLGDCVRPSPYDVPSHHQGLLSYCNKLGVPLEVEINSSRSAYLWADGGKKLQMRGYVGIEALGRTQTWVRE